MPLSAPTAALWVKTLGRLFSAMLAQSTWKISRCGSNACTTPLGPTSRARSTVCAPTLAPMSSHCHTGLHQEIEQRGFAAGELTVFAQAGADINIVPVEQHKPAAAGCNFVEADGIQGCAGRWVANGGCGPNPSGQVGGDAADDVGPVLPGLRLPVEAHAGVPRRVGAIEQPREIRREGDHGPGRYRQARRRGGAGRCRN